MAHANFIRSLAAPCRSPKWKAVKQIARSGRSERESFDYLVRHFVGRDTKYKRPSEAFGFG
jgi:hypothetical protein